MTSPVLPVGERKRSSPDRVSVSASRDVLVSNIHSMGLDLHLNSSAALTREFSLQEWEAQDEIPQPG